MTLADWLIVVGSLIQIIGLSTAILFLGIAINKQAKEITDIKTRLKRLEEP